MPTAKTKAVRKYNAKAYDRIGIVVPKGQQEVIAKHAKLHGMTTNNFIVTLIKEQLEKDNAE